MNRSAEFAGLPGPELRDALVSRMTSARLLHAEMLDIIGEMTHHPDAWDGYPSLPKYLSDLLRITTRKASGLVAQAEQVTETITPVGYVAPAKLPVVREALQDGVLDGEHVEVIASAIGDLPDWATLEHRELVETTLTDTARVHDPRVVREHGKILLARLDQDGVDPHQEDKLAEPANELSYRVDRDGWLTMKARIDPEAAEELVGMIGELAKPEKDADGMPDPRTPARRYGDAFTQIVHRAAQGDDDSAGGQKPHLHLFLDYNTLLDGIGMATLDGGHFLPATAVRRTACDAGIIPVLLGTDSVPLDLGLEHRLVKPGQRKALIARDKGCSFPGCHLPARWTDAHHVKHWADGGRTDLHNLVLLCRRHHRLVHHSAWTIHMINGLPHFTPPAWLDPNQKLRRNILRQ
jgi:hypothetical protein